MKKLLSILFSISLYLSTQAQAPASTYAELEIRLTDQSLFTLSVDQQYYPYQQYIFTIRNIMPGCHTLNITRIGTPYNPIKPDTFPATIIHQVCLLPDTKTTLVIDPRGQQSQLYTQGVISTVSPVRDPRLSLVYPDRVYNPNDSAEFLQLKKVITEAPYERVKSDVIKESAFQYGISITALEELIPLLSFDPDRLMLATYCYGFCLNQPSYWKLKKAFIFGGTYQKLIEKVDYYYPGKRRF